MCIYLNFLSVSYSCKCTDLFRLGVSMVSKGTQLFKEDLIKGGKFFPKKNNSLKKVKVTPNLYTHIEMLTFDYHLFRSLF